MNPPGYTPMPADMAAALEPLQERFEAFMEEAFAIGEKM